MSSSENGIFDVAVLQFWAKFSNFFNPLKYQDGSCQKLRNCLNLSVRPKVNLCLEFRRLFAGHDVHSA